MYMILFCVLCRNLQAPFFIPSSPFVSSSQGTTDLPIKPINRPILQDLPIIGITDPINTYIGSVSDRQIMGAIIGSSTDNYMSFFPI